MSAGGKKVNFLRDARGRLATWGEDAAISKLWVAKMQEHKGEETFLSRQFSQELAVLQSSHPYYDFGPILDYVIGCWPGSIVKARRERGWSVVDKYGDPKEFGRPCPRMFCNFFNEFKDEHERRILRVKACEESARGREERLRKAALKAEESKRRNEEYARLEEEGIQARWESLLQERPDIEKDFPWFKAKFFKNPDQADPYLMGEITAGDSISKEPLPDEDIPLPDFSGWTARSDKDLLEHV